MLEELAKAIVDSKCYDKHYFKKIFEIVARHYDIENIKLLELDDDGFAAFGQRGSLAFYCPSDDECKSDILGYNMENIWDAAEERIKKVYDNKRTKYYEPLFILNILIHEFEHARQELQIRHQKNIEGLLINDSQIGIDNYYDKLVNNRKGLLKNIGLMQYTLLMNRLYDCNPHERLAYAKGNEISASVAELIDYEAIRLFKITYFAHLIDGYSLKPDKNGIYHSPSKKFLDKLQCNNNWKEIELMAKYIEMFDKFKYGLDVNEDEMDTWQTVTRHLIR